MHAGSVVDHVRIGNQNNTEWRAGVSFVLSDFLQGLGFDQTQLLWICKIAGNRTGPLRFPCVYAWCAMADAKLSAIAVVIFIAVLLLVILLPTSFSDVEFYEVR